MGPSEQSRFHTLRGMRERGSVSVPVPVAMPMCSFCVAIPRREVRSRSPIRANFTFGFVCAFVWALQREPGVRPLLKKQPPGLSLRGDAKPSKPGFFSWRPGGPDAPFSPRLVPGNNATHVDQTVRAHQQVLSGVSDNDHVKLVIHGGRSGVLRLRAIGLMPELEARSAQLSYGGFRTTLARNRRNRIDRLHRSESKPTCGALVREDWQNGGSAYYALRYRLATETHRPQRNISPVPYTP